MTTQVTCTVRQSAHCAVLSISGEIDVGTVDRLAQAVDVAAAGRPRAVICDLRDVRLLGSTGISELLRLRGLISEWDGRVALVNCPPPVVRVLDICGLIGTFAVHELAGTWSIRETIGRTAEIDTDVALALAAADPAGDGRAG